MNQRIALTGHKNFPAMTARATLQTEPASDVVVEPSQTPKFLRLRDGDFICWKSIFLVVGGEKREITVDTLPEEQ